MAKVEKDRGNRITVGYQRLKTNEEWKKWDVKEQKWVMFRDIRNPKK